MTQTAFENTQHETEPTPVQQATTAPRKLGVGPVVGCVAAAVLIAGGAGFALGRMTADAGETVDQVMAEAAGQSRLAAAHEACENRDSDNTLSLGDGGSTIVVDPRSEYGSTAGLNCVLGELETPQSIEAQVGRTTAMMGVQDAEDDGIEYSWSYHPDNGVSMVITAVG